MKTKADHNHLFTHKTTKHALSPVIKTSPMDMMPIMSLRDFRSSSRSKGKLKLHVFNSKKPEKQIYDFQKNHNEAIKNYSSLSTLPYESPKLKMSVHDYLLSKGGPLPQKIQKQKAKKVEQVVKQKRQFKLIREIKKQKAIKEQIKKVQQQKKEYLIGSMAIQGSSPNKIHAFVQQINQIFEPQRATQQSRVEKPQKSNIVNEPKIAAMQQYSHKNIPEQSVINIEMSIKSQSGILGQVSLPNQKQETVINHPKMDQTTYKEPNLERSVFKASRILKQRKDSNSSIDVTLRESKVRAEISISLALQSKRGSKINLSGFYKDVHFKLNKGEKITCNDKLNAHLQILQSMSLFVYQSLKFDEIGDEWQQLNFLIFKKFYIQRKKVLNFLQKYPMKNPFCIYNAEISSKEIIQFMKTEAGQNTLNQLIKETNLIKDKLASIYSKFDKAKVGEKINLYEYDNFSHWIIEQLWAELILTEHNTNHDKEVINIRLCRILQLIFLISELNGKFEFSFEEAEIAIEQKQYLPYIKEGKDIFEKYILYKSEDTELDSVL